MSAAAFGAGGQRSSAAEAAARLDAQLRQVFVSFSAFGHDRAHSREAAAAALAQEPTLDCAQFQKLCRDCRLLDPLVTKESVDVVFAQAKGAPSVRRLSFALFRRALVLLAEVKYGANPDGPFAIASQVVASALSAGGGPQLDAVHLPETSHNIFERLTDASLYTSSHKLRFDADGRGRGKEGRDRSTVGQGTIDQYNGGNVVDLSSIVRPSFRGATFMSNFARSSAAALSGTVSPGAAAAAAAAAGGSPSHSRSQWGSPGAQRSARSAGERISPSHSQDSVDARPPTVALPHWRMRTEGGAAGSSPSGVAASVYFGGQSGAAGAPGSGSRGGDGGAASDGGGGGGALASGASLNGGLVSGRLQPPKVAIESTELENVFLAYCAFGTTVRMVEELDGSRFMKFCRETHLIDGKGVTPATVDLVFAKVKAAAAADGGSGSAHRGKRTIGYGDFCQALAALAPLRHPGSELLPALQATVETAILAGGPAVSTVSLMPATGSVYERLADRRFFTTSAALKDHESRSPRLKEPAEARSPR
jgi:hypothetical protein